jgi:hypothetical protein
LRIGAGVGGLVGHEVSSRDLYRREGRFSN